MWCLTHRLPGAALFLLSTGRGQRLADGPVRAGERGVLLSPGNQSLFRVFLAFEAICFFLYFLWMVFYVRSVTDEKQRQLDTIHHILRCGKTAVQCP